MDDHIIPPEGHETIGELTAVCAQIVLTCLYLARIGRPDSLWSSKYSGKVSHKMEQGLWQKIADIDQ